MLDTVHLYTEDYDLREGVKWEEPGKLVQGVFVPKKKYFNASPFVFEERQGGRLFVQFSAPKLLHTSSIFEVKEEEYNETLKRVQEGVQSVCKDFAPLDSWKVSRADFCSNLEVQEHPSEYIHLLSQFSISRMDTSETNHKTVLFRNKERQFTAYNKLAEVKHEAKKNPVLRSLIQGREENLVRLETRLLGSKSVSRVFNERETRDVNLKLVWVQNKSIEIIRGDLGRLTRVKPEQLKISFNENDERLRYFIEQGMRNSFYEFWADCGTENLLKSFGNDFELLKEWLLQYYPKATVYRLIKKVRESQARMLTPSQKDLLRELNDLLSRRVA